MDEKKIEEVMALIAAWCEKDRKAVDAAFAVECLDAVHEDVKFMHQSIAEASDAYKAIETKLRQLLGEQHG